MTNLHESMWSARFKEAGEDYLFGTEPTKFLHTHAALLAAGSTALSVADGEGRNSVWLAEQGLAVTALEISPVGLAKARKLAAGRGVNVDFVQGDALVWDWPEQAFDIVMAVFIQFASPAERPALFKGMQQAVKPGGLLFLHGYTPKQLDYKTGGPPSADHLYTSEQLRAAFAGWEILELREYEDVLAEGSAHKGRSALIDLVARK